MLAFLLFALTINYVTGVGPNLGYQYNDVAMSFEEANISCESNGMILAQPSTPALWQSMLEFCSGLSKTEDTWLGVNHHPGEGFVWGDSSGMEWSAWETGEPDDPPKYPCVVVRHNTGLWRTASCDGAHKSVCQTDVFESTIPATSLLMTNPLTTASTNVKMASGTLFIVTAIDALPVSGILETENNQTTIVCGITCLTLKCSLFAMDTNNTCNIYNASAVESGEPWVSAPGAVVYAILKK